MAGERDQRARELFAELALDRGFKVTCTKFFDDGMRLLILGDAQQVIGGKVEDGEGQVLDELAVELEQAREQRDADRGEGTRDVRSGKGVGLWHGVGQVEDFVHKLDVGMGQDVAAEQLAQRADDVLLEPVESDADGEQRGEHAGATPEQQLLEERLERLEELLELGALLDVLQGSLYNEIGGRLARQDGQVGEDDCVEDGVVLLGLLCGGQGDEALHQVGADGVLEERDALGGEQLGAVLRDGADRVGDEAAEVEHLEQDLHGGARAGVEDEVGHRLAFRPQVRPDAGQDVQEGLRRQVLGGPWGVWAVEAAEDEVTALAQGGLLGGGGAVGDHADAAVGEEAEQGADDRGGEGVEEEVGPAAVLLQLRADGEDQVGHHVALELAVESSLRVVYEDAADAGQHGFQHAGAVGRAAEAQKGSAQGGVFSALIRQAQEEADAKMRRQLGQEQLDCSITLSIHREMKLMTGNLLECIL